MTPPATSALNSALLIGRMEQPVAPSRLHELTSRLGCGDDTAWQEFHCTYGATVFRRLLAATRGDYDLASEALQQVYLRVARYVRPCDSEPMFLAWLQVVGRTSINDCRRRRMSFWGLLRRRANEPEVDGMSGDDADQRLQSALDGALLELNPTDRALLEAKYLMGHSVRLLAEQLTISPKAVESRLTRARAELRQRVLSALSRHE